MILPFMNSLKDVLRDLIGTTLYDLIPQATINTLGEYYIVDIVGILVWTVIFLLIGILLGRATK